MKKLILASSSPRRKELLEQIHLSFDIDVSAFEEDNTLPLEPEELVRHFSQQKAHEVALKHHQAIIIAADTIVVLQEHILGKPKTLEEAKDMLRALSGNIHDVLTGLTVIDTENQREVSSVVKTRIAFRQISEAEITYYVDTCKPLDKAGAYGIQEFSAIFAERIEGDYNNIVGLPLYKLTENLTQLGVNILDYVKR